MADQSTASDDDFVDAVDRDRLFRNRMDQAISVVAAIRHNHCPKKHRVSKKSKRGPQAQVSKFKLYHLPEMSDVPNFNSVEERCSGIVKRHMEQGFGFPPACFDSESMKPKTTSVSISLTGQQFIREVYSLCPKLNGQPFNMYKSNERKRLERIVDLTPASLRAFKYQGVFIVCVGHFTPTGAIVTANEEDDDADLRPGNFEHTSLSESRNPVNQIPHASVSVTKADVDRIDHEASNPNARSLTSAFPTSVGRSDPGVQQMPQSSYAMTMPPTSAVIFSNDTPYMPSRTATSSSSNSPALIHTNSRQEMSHSDNSSRPSVSIVEDRILHISVELEEKKEMFTLSHFSKPQNLQLEVAHKFGLEEQNFIILAKHDRSVKLPSHSNLDLFHWSVKSGEYVIEQDIDNFFGLTFIENVLEDDEETEVTFETDMMIQCLRSKIPKPWDAKLRNQIAAFLGNHGLGMIPNERNFSSCLEMISYYALYVRPFYLIRLMCDAIPVHLRQPFLFPNEAVFKRLMEEMRPSARTILAVLDVKYSGDDSAYGIEEKVAGFLETFIASLSHQDVKFVTGAEITPSVIRVEFNGETKPELMIPSAHTCANTIHLSKYYLSYGSFCSALSHLLSNEYWLKFDMA